MKVVSVEDICLMAGLSARQSQVLLLARDGLSDLETAERLGISLAAVRCAATKARKKLRAEAERVERETALQDLVRALDQTDV